MKFYFENTYGTLAIIKKKNTEPNVIIGAAHHAKTIVKLIFVKINNLY